MRSSPPADAEVTEIGRPTLTGNRDIGGRCPGLEPDGGPIRGGIDTVSSVLDDVPDLSPAPEDI